MFDLSFQEALRTFKLYKEKKIDLDVLYQGISGCIGSFSAINDNKIREFFTGYAWELDDLIFLDGAKKEPKNVFIYLQTMTSTLRRNSDFYNNKISLGFEILNRIQLVEQRNESESIRAWFDAIAKKYTLYEDDSINDALEAFQLVVKEWNNREAQILALQIIMNSGNKYVLKEKSTYIYDQIRLAIELFFQIDQEYYIQKEIAQWAKKTKETYEHDMDPKAKEILTELEIMAYMKELEKSMEEIRDLAINLIKSNVNKI